MNAKTILFATDFSPASQAALIHATALARDASATLVVLHVEEVPIPYGGGEMFVPLPVVDQATLARELATVVPADPAVNYTHRLMVGDATTEILQTAEDEQADFIVLGSHGRTGLTRLLMGSVAEQVVRRSHCPVLVVKQPTAVVPTAEKSRPATAAQPTLAAMPHN